MLMDRKLKTTELREIAMLQIQTWWSIFILNFLLVDVMSSAVSIYGNASQNGDTAWKIISRWRLADW